MLMSNSGEIVVRGSKVDIMADLATLLNSLHERNALTAEEIDKCVEIAKWSEGKLDEEAEKAENELKSKIKEDLKSMLDEIFG